MAQLYSLVPEGEIRAEAVVQHPSQTAEFD